MVILKRRVRLFHAHFPAVHVAHHHLGDGMLPLSFLGRQQRRALGAEPGCGERQMGVAPRQDVRAVAHPGLRVGGLVGTPLRERAGVAVVPDECPPKSIAGDVLLAPVHDVSAEEDDVARLRRDQ